MFGSKRTFLSELKFSVTMFKTNRKYVSQAVCESSINNAKSKASDSDPRFLKSQTRTRTSSTTIKFNATNSNENQKETEFCNAYVKW